MHRQPDYVRRAVAPDLPNNAPSEAYVARARALAEQDNYEAAARVMEAAIEAHPDDAWAHYWRGAMDEERGQTEEAIAAYREAIRIQPKLIEAQTKLAGVLVRAGRLREALDRLQTVVALDPVHQPRAWFNLGLIRTQTGDIGGARDAFDRAATLDPDLVPAHIQLGTLYLQAELFEEAIPHFRNAVVADSTNPSAVGSLGMAHLQLGHTDQARQLFERVLELDPDNQGARTLLERLGRD
jgi:tetratricopeptide (TPR) repeat protein